MKQTQTLRMNYEFSRVYQKGRYISARHVVLHYLKRNGSQNRLGITASRKVNGSVRRNRMKRLLRESYRLVENQIKPGYDLVLVGRDSTVPPDLKTVYPEVMRLLQRAGLYRPVPQKPDTGSNGTET
ncbi:MAG: ribonuclease P protein component [Bacillota bacterium]|nr:ribonuclease P protein component [Bacillota bacterium]